ncbi:hypothetical protein AURDEDRAFT_123920 [Auricularia subglabra TFB-10046 SS5]|nr:hypothetical protein AURDEDRAFT_123920 [Auricularia subglabra TFB-10046 SS5]
MSEIVIEDNDESHVSYYPVDAWEFRTRSVSDDDYHGASYHLTSTPGAYVTFTFNGSYVAYYSDLNVDHGAFTVLLDGQTVLTDSSQSDTLQKQRVLFGRAISPGHHVLTIENAQDTKITGVDFFMWAPCSLSRKLLMCPTSYHSNNHTSVPRHLQSAAICSQPSHLGFASWIA